MRGEKQTWMAHGRGLDMRKKIRSRRSPIRHVTSRVDVEMLSDKRYHTGNVFRHRNWGLIISI